MKKAAFFDLDGTIITTRSGRPFPLHSEDWLFIHKTVEFMKGLIRQNWKIIIISNQGGISQGFLTIENFEYKIKNIIKALNELFKEERKTNKEPIEYLYCKDYPTSYRRKPMPGMIYEAASKYKLDIVNSIMIGDMITDEQLSINAGLVNYISVHDIIDTYEK